MIEHFGHASHILKVFRKAVIKIDVFLQKNINRNQFNNLLQNSPTIQNPIYTLCYARDIAGCTQLCGFWLKTTDYFWQWRVLPLPDTFNCTIPIVVKVMPKKRVSRKICLNFTIGLHPSICPSFVNSGMIWVNVRRYWTQEIQFLVSKKSGLYIK
jgi:hypothetical protein